MKVNFFQLLPFLPILPVNLIFFTILPVNLKTGKSSTLVKTEKRKKIVLIEKGLCEKGLLLTKVL